jgi:hypothetical protein
MDRPTRSTPIHQVADGSLIRGARAYAVALGRNGTTWVAGSTAASDGSLDAFVAKLDSSERFWLSNAKRGFNIRVTDPSPTAVPRAAGDGPTSAELPVRLEGPTADGPLVYDTVVELRRASPVSKHWKR